MRKKNGLRRSFLLRRAFLRCSLVGLSASLSIGCVGEGSNQNPASPALGAVTPGGIGSSSALASSSSSGAASQSSSWVSIGDCRTNTDTGAVSVTATSATGYKYLDIKYEPTASVSATTVAAVMGTSGCSTFSGAALTMDIYSDSGGSPDASITHGAQTVPCSQLSAPPTAVSVTFSPVALSGGTRYHVVMKIGGLSGGDSVELDLYGTASANCPSTGVGSILEGIAGAWTEESGASIGMLRIN